MGATPVGRRLSGSDRLNLPSFPFSLLPFLPTISLPLSLGQATRGSDFVSLRFACEWKNNRVFFCKFWPHVATSMVVNRECLEDRWWRSYSNLKEIEKGEEPLISFGIKLYRRHRRPVSNGQPKRCCARQSSLASSSGEAEADALACRLRPVTQPEKRKQFWSKRAWVKSCTVGNLRSESRAPKKKD